MKRLYVSLAILTAILLGPYWLYIPLLVVALWYVPMYWEGIVLGFLADSLYGLGAYGWLQFPFPIALLGAILFLIFIPIRERIRSN
jgi:hypothetical protein